MAPADAVSPPGLQLERTSLAWQRTNLSLLVATLISARLIATWALWPGVLLALVGTAVAATLALLQRRRFLAAVRALADARPLPDGRAHLGLLMLLGLLGLGALGVLVLVQ